jgi:hypothetical protein
MSSARQIWITGAACAILVGLAGCQGEGPEIKGTVKLDGKALDGVRVSFLPLDPKLGGAVAETDATGAFKIMPQADGVTLMPGKYGVTFSRMVDAQGNVPPARDRLMLEKAGKLTERIPAKYSAQTAMRADTPPAEIVEIKDEPAELTFDLKTQ